MTLGLSGFGGDLLCLQPRLGLRTLTSGGLRACLAFFSRSGSVLRGPHESLRRPEHLFIQPEIVGVAFGSLPNPSTLKTMWAAHSADPATTRQTSLSVLHPEGLRFLRLRLGWFAH